MTFFYCRGGWKSSQIIFEAPIFKSRPLPFFLTSSQAFSACRNDHNTFNLSVNDPAIRFPKLLKTRDKMSFAARRFFVNPRPLRSLVVANSRRSYATIPTKNEEPTTPIEPSREQAMPIGRFYEAILNDPQPIPDVKPEEPASSVKEVQKKKSEPKVDTEAPAPKSTRGKKPKEEKAAPVPASAAAAPSKTAPKSKTASKPLPKTMPSAPETSASAPPPSPSVSTLPPVPTPPPTSAQEKAKVIFGSSLAGPAERAERLAEMRSRSSLIAGVLVPPKPDEPDNCCMSGCVNCVWERFRDEMEEWAAANAHAEKRLSKLQQTGGDAGSSSVPPPAGVGAAAVGERGSTHVAVSMDDDGGGSETNWEVDVEAHGSGKIVKNFWDDDLYRNVPVGIREFMKQEKRIKEKHMREGTSGG